MSERRTNTPPDAPVAARYVLGERIGQGTYSTVWQATDTLLHRSVAIKAVRLPPGPAMIAVTDRLVAAARAAMRVAHPGTAAVLDVVEDGDGIWVVSELVPAPSLRELVAREGRIPVDRAATIGGQVLAALGAAHHHGIVHHDVQPGTVLVGTDGRVKLVDVGSETIKSEPALAARRASPHLLGPGGHGPETDLRALGATLWFAVDGSAPDAVGDARGDPARALGAAAVPGTAGPLAPVIGALLAATAYARPRGTELLEQLDRIASGRMAAVWWPRALPPPPPQRSQPPAAHTLSTPSTQPIPGETSKPIPGEVTPPNRGGTTQPRPVEATRPGPGRATATLDRTVLQPKPRKAAPEEAAPGRRARRWRRLPALALLVVVALTVVAAVGDWLAGATPPGPPAAGAATTTPAGTHGGMTPTGSAGTGWTQHTDPDAGFTVAVPPGWRELPDNVRDVVFTDPRTRAAAAVTRVEDPPADLAAVARHAERNYRGLDYRRIRLAPTLHQGHPAVLWEFEFTSDGTRIHATDLHIHAGDHTYVLGFQAPAARWEPTAPIRRRFTESFRAP